MWVYKFSQKSKINIFLFSYLKGLGISTRYINYLNCKCIGYSNPSPNPRLILQVVEKWKNVGFMRKNFFPQNIEQLDPRLSPKKFNCPKQVSNYPYPVRFICDYR